MFYIATPLNKIRTCIPNFICVVIIYFGAITTAGDCDAIFISDVKRFVLLKTISLLRII
jgi:hypothetical protein